MRIMVDISWQVTCMHQISPSKCFFLFSLSLSLSHRDGDLHHAHAALMISAESPTISLNTEHNENLKR